MFMKKALGVGVAAMALSAMLGCCDSGGNPVNCGPAPAARAGNPPLLKDVGACRGAPPPESLPFPRACGEVRGELVYNLGQGALSNSSAVRLAGGVDNPRPMRVSGGVIGRCNPIPDRSFENAAGVRTPAAPVAAPDAVSTPAALREPAVFEPGVAAGGFCAPVVCPVIPGSAEVCKPGTNLSECFTLSESELASGPTVYTPVSGEIVPAAPAAAAVESPAPAPEKAANAADKYVNLGKAEALTPPPSLDKEPAAATAGADAIPEAPTAAFPAETRNNAGSSEPMPPVPLVTDMDDAVDAIMTREGYNTSSLPEVKLPPKLN